MPRRGQRETEGQFRNGIGVGARRIDDNDASRRCRRNVDIVDTDSVLSDDFEAPDARDRLGRQRTGSRDHGIRNVRPRREFTMSPVNDLRLLPQ